MTETMEVEDACTVCKNTKYLNPSMKMMFSPCYHRMCDACVHRIFLAGEAPCPICKIPLRKNQFSTQTFDDLEVEKEIKIRRNVAKYMAKSKEDFRSIDEYNDYLELVEDYVFQLLHDENIQKVYAEMELFRTENKQVVEKAIRKRVEQEKNWLEALDEENLKRKRLAEEDQQVQQEERMQKLKEKESLINEMMLSDQPASLLVAKKQKRQLKPSSSQRSQEARKSVYRLQTDTLDLSKEPTAGALSKDILADVYQLSFTFPKANVKAYEDPVLTVWIDNPAIIAGGSRSWHFQEKAIQMLYSNLCI